MKYHETILVTLSVLRVFVAKKTEDQNLDEEYQ
jgi:hypothetical protein